MGGIDFVRSFVRKHHDFSILKQSDSTTINRAHGFNKKLAEDTGEPLKYHLQKAVVDWNLSNPGKVFTIYDLSACFAESYFNTCTNQAKIDAWT